MKQFNRFWRDEAGAILSAEIMMVASILVVGATVGLKSVRDSVVTELADVAQALSNVDQSYYFGGTGGHGAFTAGGLFLDLPDFCDLPGNVAYQESKCVSICGAPLHPTGPEADGGAAAPVIQHGVVIQGVPVTGERANAVLHPNLGEAAKATDKQAVPPKSPQPVRKKSTTKAPQPKKQPE